MAVAHNGNLVNARPLKEKLEAQGSIFQSTMDSEIFVHLIARSKKPGYLEKTIQALSQVRGAYSLVLLTENGLIGARDPHGFRPLCLGRLNGSFVLASETGALDLVQARYKSQEKKCHVEELLRARSVELRWLRRRQSNGHAD